MAKRLDETKRHNGVVPFGGKGDDFFEFNIPHDERFKNARLDVLRGCWNIGARIEAEPKSGETGPGKRIKVHWWFDGGNPFKRGYIEYRIRAYTEPVDSRRAILVAIENTGYTKWVDENFSGEMKRRIERFIDSVTEMGEEQNCRNLFKTYYKKCEILVDTTCTKENIRTKIAELGSAYDALDLAIIGHGGEYPEGSRRGVLVLFNGMSSWTTNSLNLNEDDVRTWAASSEFQSLKLGLVYMMNCYGSKFNDAWRALGFKTSIGSDQVNYMPEPMFSFFWTRFLNGETAETAARKAWEDSKNMWQFLYLPSCELKGTSLPPFFELVCEANPFIIESRPVIAGSKNLRFTDSP